MTYLLTFLVVVANVLGAGMIVPQVSRLRRTRVSLGVSAVGVGVGIAQNLWWVTYGLQADGAFSIVPVSVAGTVLYGTIAVQLARIDGLHVARPILTGFLGIGVIPLIPYVLVSLEAAGLVIGLLYGVQFAPAAVAAFRTRQPVGVSAATWSMAFIEALVWLVYGLYSGDPALTVGGAGGAFMSGVILVRLAAVRPRARPRLAL